MAEAPAAARVCDGWRPDELRCSLADAFSLIGGYVGHILKGDKPLDLPVQQQTTAEFVVNLKTAMSFGLTIPLPLLGRADEVIE